MGDSNLRGDGRTLSGGNPAEKGDRPEQNSPAWKGCRSAHGPAAEAGAAAGGLLPPGRTFPQIEPGSMRELADQLDQEIAAAAMEAALSLYDFSTKTELEINGFDPLYPASMIKTLLLLAALHGLEEGRLSLQELHYLCEQDRYAGGTRVAGSGILQYAENGSAYTFQELLSLMVSFSDNIATNIVYDRVGAPAVAETARKLGLRQTAFTRKMYEMESPLPSNVSTVHDLTRLLVALEERQFVGDSFSEMGIRMMLETIDKGRIGRYLDGGAIKVANKVGTVTGIVGDMALIYLPARPPLALTVAVKNPPDQEEAARLIGRLARIAVEYFT